MRYLSVCSGIEAATVAWHPLGWEPVAFAEIEKFPSAVLAHHYPSVPNWGDMTRYREWPDACNCDSRHPERGPTTARGGLDGRRNHVHPEHHGAAHGGAGSSCPRCGGLAVDVVVGGTPCQSFSVAGLRKGLDDPRGNLALVFLGLVDRYRPRWVVWENVPGVRSSGEGRDLGAFLGGLAELGYGWAYRSLDAQYFGLAQRRERVFVVAHLGDWRPPCAVLFEPESLSGDSAPSREAGEGVAPTIASRPTGGGGLGTDFDLDGGVIQTVGALCADAHPGAYSGQDAYTGRLVPQAIDIQQVTSKTNRSRPTPESPPLTTNGTVVAFSSKDHGADAGELAPTLRSMGHDSSHANGGGQVAVAFTQNQREEVRDLGDLAAVVKEPGMHEQTFVKTGMAVRRLTPRECERLQGFQWRCAPDFPGAWQDQLGRWWSPDYTLIPYRGKPAKDGPRYKALGNSMAVPVMAWIGERIALCESVLGEAHDVRVA